MCLASDVAEQQNIDQGVAQQQLEKNYLLLF